MSFIVKMILPQFLGVYIAFWLNEDLPEWRRSLILKALPCFLLIILVMLWIIRKQFNPPNFKRRERVIQVSIYSACMLWFIGAIDVSGLLESRTNASFRSGIFVTIFFIAYIILALLYRARIRREESERVTGTSTKTA